MTCIISDDGQMRSWNEIDSTEMGRLSEKERWNEVDAEDETLKARTEAI